MARGYNQKIARIKQLKLNVLDRAGVLAETSPGELGVPKRIHERFCEHYEAARMHPEADSVLYRGATQLEKKLEGFKRYELIRPLAVERRALHYALNEDFQESRNLRRIGFRIAMATVIAACITVAVFFPPFAIFASLMAVISGYLAIFPPKLDLFNDFSLTSYGVSEAEYQDAAFSVSDVSQDLQHEYSTRYSSRGPRPVPNPSTAGDAPRGYNPRFFKTEEQLRRAGVQQEVLRNEEDLTHGRK